MEKALKRVPPPLSPTHLELPVEEATVEEEQATPCWKVDEMVADEAQHRDLTGRDSTDAAANITHASEDVNQRSRDAEALVVGRGAAV